MIISIIIATLNSEKTLPHLLDSVYEQDCLDNFEIIFIDGNSEDATLELIENHPLNSILVSEIDFGIYDALNKGIKISSGEFYLVIGSDDYFVRGAFSKLIHEIKTNSGYDLYLFPVIKGNKIVRPRKLNYLRRIISWSWIFSSHSMGTLIKKDLHNYLGFYSNKYPLLADGDFFKKAIINCSTIHISNVTLGVFGSEGVTSLKSVQLVGETWMIQVENGENIFIQTILLILRVTLIYAQKIFLLRMVCTTPAKSRVDA
jgi:glycosyltransferase involved in cell wall biosynthesis